MVWGEPIAMITVTPIITIAMTDGIMSTKQPLLTALQWLSPAFPVGSFAYSHGLEWAIEAGHIKDEPTLQSWLQDLIALGSGRSDAILVSLAHCAEDRAALKSLNDLALALAPSSERRAETVLQGQAFCQTLKDVWDYDISGLCYPVAVGYGAFCAGLDRADITAAYLHAYVANLISAAVRLVPLGQTQGQRILLGLMPDILEVGTAALSASEEDLTSAGFLSDVASMRHETLKTRIFKT